MDPFFLVRILGAAGMAMVLALCAGNTAQGKTPSSHLAVPAISAPP